MFPSIYVRVSSREQVENLSLDTQEAACREYCRRAGWEVLRVFREEGESATTTSRTQLLAMLQFCRGQPRDIDFVLFYRVDRFSRDALDYLLVRRDLLELGIKLRSVQEGFDDSPDGEMQEGLQAILAQWDNRKRSQRTKAGMREALARGRWPWGAPLGYCWRDKTLVPHPDRAPQVRLAFELAAAGSTVPEIRAELSRRGLSVPRSTVHRMLANPIYAGRLVAPEWGIDVEGDARAAGRLGDLPAGQQGKGRRLGPRVPHGLDSGFSLSQPDAVR